MVDLPISRVRWSKAHRIISTVHPPIDLFEDIADPADWQAIMEGESMSNARVLENIGELSLVPEDRRVGGPGSSYVMAPFTHVNPAWEGRFHSGHAGAYYAANRLETAIAETTYHRAAIYRATNEAPGWFSQFRQLVGKLDARLHDLRDNKERSDCLDPDDYGASQALSTELRHAGSNGIVYPSVRDPKGECIAAFYPDVANIPVQADAFAYHFDGERIDIIRNEMTGDVFRLI